LKLLRDKKSHEILAPAGAMSLRGWCNQIGYFDTARFSLPECRSIYGKKKEKSSLNSFAFW
jgi:hypothetical protein